MIQEMANQGAHLLAKARYNNLSETEDELSFRQGDVVTVLKKDFNQQRDWWLCELRGKVGMVPANYLEIFHEQANYDIPKASKSSPSPGPSVSHVPQPRLTMDVGDNAIYDLPPADELDYDLPPNEDPIHDPQDYARPPSSSRLSPMDNRSSTKSNRASMGGSSVASHSSSIYDVPPEMDTYDMPKPHREAEEREAHLLAVDLTNMYDDEAKQRVPYLNISLI